MIISANFRRDKSDPAEYARQSKKWEIFVAEIVRDVDVLVKKRTQCKADARS